MVRLRTDNVAGGAVTFSSGSTSRPALFEQVSGLPTGRPPPERSCV